MSEFFCRIFGHDCWLTGGDYYTNEDHKERSFYHHKYRCANCSKDIVKNVFEDDGRLNGLRISTEK